MKSKKIILNSHHGALFYCLLTLLTFVVFNGCDEEEDNVMNPPPVENASKLSGTISNYPGGSVIAKVKFELSLPPDSFFVGIDTIDNDGVLNMTLVTPPTNYLMPSTDFSSPSVVVNDSSARYTNFRLVNIYNFSNSQIGVMPKKNFADTLMPGSFFVESFFATKPFTITGSDTNSFGIDTSIIHYNLSLAAGWNKVTLRVVDITPDFQEVEYINGELSGATWRYEAFSSAIGRPKIFLDRQLRNNF